MHNIPRVTICLPVFNGERYLSDAIESLLAQSFDNFELLVSDDCSSDDSAQIVENYAKQDKRIRHWTNTERLGLFANYNKCFNLATGEYIKPFAQDDLIAKETLKRMVALLKQHDEVALAASRRQLIDKDGKVLPTHLQPIDIADSLGEAALYASGPVIKASLQNVITNLIGEPSAVMFRASTRGSGFNTKFRHAGDLEFWLRILRSGNLGLIAEPLVHFRVHDDASTAKNIKGLWNVADIIHMADENIELLQQINLSKDEFIKKNLAIVSRHLPPSEWLIDAKQNTEPVTNLDLHALQQALLYSLQMYTEPTQQVGEEHYRKLVANEYIIRGMENEVRKLLKSKSWKLTRPLREVNRIFQTSEEASWTGSQEREKGNKPIELQKSYLQYLDEKRTRILGSRSWRYTKFLRKSSSTEDDYRPLIRRVLEDLPTGVNKKVEKDIARKTGHWAKHKRDKPAPYDLIIAIHETSRTGAPLLALALCKKLSELNFNVLAILKEDGELSPQIAAMTDVLSLSRIMDKASSLDHEIKKLIEQELIKTDAVAFVNSAEWHSLNHIFAQNGIKTVTLIHEFLSNYSRKERESLLTNSSINVYSSKATQSDAKACSESSPESHIIPQGLIDPSFGQMSRGVGKEHLRRSLGIPLSSFVVLACGSTDQRKGLDLFIQVASMVLREDRSAKDIHFIWIGGEKFHNYDLFWWARHDVRKAKLEHLVHLIGNQSDIEPYFAGSDVFVLPSRQDPLPCVMHQAMAVGLPIIAFEGSGGAEDLVLQGVGTLVPYLSANGLAQAILEYYRNPIALAAHSQAGRKLILSYQHSMDRYVRELLLLAGLQKQLN